MCIVQGNHALVDIEMLNLKQIGRKLLITSNDRIKKLAFPKLNVILHGDLTGRWYLHVIPNTFEESHACCFLLCNYANHIISFQRKCQNVFQKYLHAIILFVNAVFHFCNL